MTRIAVAFLLLAAALCAPGARAQDINSTAKSLKFIGTSYTAYDQGKKIWEIHAKQVKGDQKRIKATFIRGTLYKKEKPYYFLKAPLAEINPANNNILFPHGALLTGVKGELLRATVLVWDAAQKKFVGTKGVEVIRLNTRLLGDTMILKQDFANLTLEGHVKVSVNP